ncbi:HemN C-terminal domain protein [Bacteriovorax sp. Seq25_V]|nr:HemN C-terminal domain protein [Bacteriovorax sp. Seq25_V]
MPKNDDEVTKFEALLGQMIVRQKSLMSELGYQWGDLETIYIGGGTPSLWGRRGAGYIRNFLLNEKVSITSNCEFTLEVNPGSWTSEGLEDWKKSGVNRFSLGIQSLDSRFIKLLDRVHNIDDVYATLEKFKEMDANFSVDFMLGLPQSETLNRDVIKELETILTYNPSHISLYILTTKDHYVHQSTIPSDEWIEKEYLAVSEYLQKNGFEHYEVSNFAKKGMASKHNLRYWQMKSVGALGPSATGYLSEKNYRYKWKVSTADFVPEVLEKKDVVLETLYMNLRISDGLSLTFFNDKEKDEQLAVIAESWINRGLGEIRGRRIILNSRGFLILDFLMDEIFSKINF